MSDPSPKYVCPSCGEAFDKPSRFCGRCGATMQDESITSDTALARTRLSTEDNTAPGRQGRRAQDTGRDPWLGKVVDSRYRVIEVIGRGGMGVVYKVEHQRMGKIAAMKVLHHEFADDPEVVERFRREAEVVARLEHQNTVHVFDFGKARGALYLIMEYVRGQDLGSLIKRDGPMPFARSAPLFVQICASLSEAHAVGVVHRDLKPENILVTRTHRGRDFVKVLDFGLAKLSEREELAEVTDRGSIVGTPYYMSPEQIRGEEVDRRTDIYALGALMYRVITGQHAFTAGTPVGVLTHHLTTELVLPSRRAPDLDIHPEVDRIIARAMAKVRDDRYSSIGEVFDELERVFLLVTEDQSMPFGLIGSSVWSSDPDSSSQVKVGPGMDDSDEIDYGIDTSVRLRRSDLDDYERSLKRRRRLRIAVVPLLLLAVAAVVVYLVAFRPETPLTAEQEPNNQLDDANLIATDRPVTGFLGKRISKTSPDQDYFRITRGDVDSVVSAHVTALPNIDVELSMFDPNGKLLARADEGGVGVDERIRRLRTLGPVHLLVTEAMPTGPRLPVENVSDSYTLTVEVTPVTEELETEPNELPSDAHLLTADRPVTGHLDRRGDVDVYRFNGSPGAYQLDITGADGVPLSWKVEQAPASSQRSAEITLNAGDHLYLSRTDQAAPRDALLPGANAPYTIQVTRASGTSAP